MGKLRQCATMIAFVFISAIMLTACGAKVELKLTTQSGILTAKPGQTVQFETEIKSKDEKDKSQTVTYQIKSGQAYGTITAQGLLTVKNDAPVDSEIVVVSTLNKVTSNEVTIVVASIPLNEINITANKETIIKGGFANLTVQLIPENTTQKNYEWVIIEGKQEASVDGNKLLINDDATAGAEIIVQAISGTIESNTLTFTIAKSSGELLFLTFTNENILLDYNDPAPQPKLEAVIRDGTGNKVTDKEVVFSIEEGEGLISIDRDGYNAKFTILGHGEAKVSAMISGTDIAEEATVKVILPPDTFEIPEVFEGKSSYSYAKGSEESPNEMDFNIAMTKLEGKNSVAQKYNVTFERDGVLDNDAASYNETAILENAITGNITFNKTGRIKAIVQSDSGSKVETKREFTFNINEGVNITTFEELKRKLESAGASGFNNIPLNITVLSKVEGLDGEEFGYSLMPAQSLVKEENQIDDFNNVKIIVASNFDTLTIYGNDHSIDTSKLRKFTKAGHIEALIDFRCSSALSWDVKNGGVPGDDEPTRHGIDIFDLHFYGNTGVNDTTGNTIVPGAYRHALKFGEDNVKSLYTLNIKNVTFSGFNIGMRISHAVHSTIEDVAVNNIYATGIEVCASKITFKDMVFGKCGATGIEITPDNDKFSGHNFNQEQEVNFAGTFESTNYNNGDTQYFQKWGEAMGGALADMIPGFEFNFVGMLAANLGAYEEAVRQNVYNTVDINDDPENPDAIKFVFVALIFNDLEKEKQNNSVVNYLNFDSNGIIDIADMEGCDDTHQYVTMTIYLTETKEVGKVLLLNLNYGKAAPAAEDINL